MSYTTANCDLPHHPGVEQHLLRMHLLQRRQMVILFASSGHLDKLEFWFNAKYFVEYIKLTPLGPTTLESKWDSKFSPRKSNASLLCLWVTNRGLTINL